MGFFKKLFNKEDDRVNPDDFLPNIMGLRVGCSFEIDALHLKLILPKLMIQQCSQTQIITAAGYVNLDGTHIFRFYTDDEAFLQVIAENGVEEQHIVDVKLFHYYDTLDVSQQQSWDDLLQNKIGTASYQLEQHTFERVWTSATDYHSPVAMQEKTYDASSEDKEDYDTTDQFTMLFERQLDEDLHESLFLSAEEREQDNGQLSRSFVISTGMALSPSQITING